jgi:hypothetical protein
MIIISPDFLIVDVWSTTDNGQEERQNMPAMKIFQAEVIFDG